MLYLTYNDQPSGVFSSQVIDTGNFLNSSGIASIRLVAFISMRGFGANRKKIKNEDPGAWVLPILPKAMYPGFSSFVFFLICLFTGERQIICRNVLAFKMAAFSRTLGLKMRICYDGRGAIAAEWNEYEVVPSEKLKKAIFEMEREAVLHSDYRIAVSQQLVHHWKQTFNYSEKNHVVIPCTVNSNFKAGLPDTGVIAGLRQKFGYESDDTVMVYSGSSAGWQSFGALENLLRKSLSASKNIKLLFLSGADPAIESMKKAFPGQVDSKWLRHTEVTEALLACDMGILYREHSVTNQVASPTKFAEYLSAGLPVIISDHLGDYSEFVRTERCGQVVQNTTTPISVYKSSHAERERLNQIVEIYFTKQSQSANYRKVVQALSSN